MTIRKTCKWTFILVAIIAAGGWYAVQYAFDHKDRLVLDGIRKEVARKIPNWGVTIESATIDLQGRVKLTDVVVTPQGETPPLAVIPVCYVTLDTDVLLENKTVLVRTVRIVKPRLSLHRNADGEWNFDGLSKPPASDQTPEISIVAGDILVRSEAVNGFPATEVGSRNVSVKLVPKGQKRYLIEGATQIEGAGAITFGGEFDINSGAWRLNGRTDQLDISPALLEKAAAFSPDLERRVSELTGGRTTSPLATSPLATNPVTVIPVTATGPTNDPVDEQTNGPVIRTASIEQVAAPQLRLPSLGLSANVSLEFALAGDGVEPLTEYRVLAKVTGGEVTQPISPVRLSHLQGELLVENGRLVVHQFSASNGASRLALNGQVHRQDGRTLTDFEVSAEKLLIDRELRNLLPPSTQRLFDKINPSGLFTVKGRFRSDGVNSPVVRLDEFTALDCSIRHAMFAYPVTGITGTVKQEADVLIVEMQGDASGQPVFIKGTVTNPGPEASAQFDVLVDDLPIDRQFMESIVDPKLQGARRAIELLRLTGRLNLRAHFARQAGLGQPTLMGLDADLVDGSAKYERFPYPISHLTGHVHFNPWKDRVWKFTNMRGRHDGATLAGTGTFDLNQKPALLSLAINAANVTIKDRDLFDATTTASPDLYHAWVELNPTAGVAQFKNITVQWQHGSPPIIELPDIHVDQGALTLASFPFPWSNVTGDLAWKDGRLLIQQATARHEETLLEIEGRQHPGAAYFDVLPRGADRRWQLHLEDVTVRNLDPGSEFRRSLPGDVADVFVQLDPRSPLDADIQIEMAGYADPQGGPDIVTADWRMKAAIHKDRLSVGVDLEDVSGTIEAQIEWDGAQVVGNGRLDFSTARAFDMTFTEIRGPFTIDDSVVTLGSPIMLLKPRPGVPAPQVPPDEQLTASLYGGTVTVNAETRLHPTDAEQVAYRSRVTAKGCDLSLWAKEWEIAESGIDGIAHGELNLSGRGTSELGLKGQDCWMQINDARLGELPVVAQTLAQMFSPQQRDKTAFRYGYLEFNIRDGIFDFGPPGTPQQGDTRRIQLVGDAFKLVGRGYVPFAPQLDPSMGLHFYSKADNRNPLVSLPLVSTIIKPLSDNWFHVIVTGPPADPRIVTRTEVPIDNAFREFFRSLESGFMPVVPRPR